MKISVNMTARQLYHFLEISEDSYPRRVETVIAVQLTDFSARLFPAFLDPQYSLHYGFREYRFQIPCRFSALPSPADRIIQGVCPVTLLLQYVDAERSNTIDTHLAQAYYRIRKMYKDYLEARMPRKWPSSCTAFSDRGNCGWFPNR